MWIQLDDAKLREIVTLLRERAKIHPTSNAYADNKEAISDINAAERIEWYLNDQVVNKEDNDKYRDAARDLLTDEDDVDADAVISEGDDPGAYVMCWKWVSHTEAGFVLCDQCETRRIDPQFDQMNQHFCSEECRKDYFATPPPAKPKGGFWIYYNAIDGMVGPFSDSIEAGRQIVACAMDMPAGVPRQFTLFTADSLEEAKAVVKKLSPENP